MFNFLLRVAKYTVRWVPVAILVYAILYLLWLLVGEGMANALAADNDFFLYYVLPVVGFGVFLVGKGCFGDILNHEESRWHLLGLVLLILVIAGEVILEADSRYKIFIPSNLFVEGIISLEGWLPQMFLPGLVLAYFVAFMFLPLLEKKGREDRNNPSGNKGELSDLPLINPEDDGLGVRDFSKGMAREIFHLKGEEGYVFALYGEWGGGKSTIINFIDHYLKEFFKEEGRGKKETLNVAFFNPWGYGTPEKLASAFLERISDEVNKVLHGHTMGRYNFSRVLGQLTDVSLGGVNFKRALHQPDFNQIVRRIGDRLTESNIRILVVIDDLDRMLPEEVKRIFDLVKGVSNIKNVMYLMAFDDTRVAKNLERSCHIEPEYLEKIVQKDFRLPRMPRKNVWEFFVTNLHTILKDVYAEAPDQSEDKIIMALKELEERKFLLREFLYNLRRCKHLLNSLKSSLPPKKDEVNIFDFTLLEVLKEFYPVMFNSIARNEHLLVKDLTNSGLSEGRKKEIENVVRGWTEPYKERKKELLELMVALFPQTNKVLGLGAGRSSKKEAEQAEQRISSVRCVYKYFEGQIAEGEISDQKMREMLSQLEAHKQIPQGATEKLNRIVRELDEEKLVPYFLEYLPMYLEDKPGWLANSIFNNIPHAIKGLSDHGQDDFPQGMLDRTLNLQVEILRKKIETRNWVILLSDFNGMGVCYKNMLLFRVLKDLNYRISISRAAGAPESTKANIKKDLEGLVRERLKEIENAAYKEEFFKDLKPYQLFPVFYLWMSEFGSPPDNLNSDEKRNKRDTLTSLLGGNKDKLWEFIQGFYFWNDAFRHQITYRDIVDYFPANRLLVIVNQRLSDGINTAERAELDNFAGELHEAINSENGQTEETPEPDEAETQTVGEPTPPGG